MPPREEAFIHQVKQKDHFYNVDSAQFVLQEVPKISTKYLRPIKVRAMVSNAVDGEISMFAKSQKLKGENDPDIQQQSLNQQSLKQIEHDSAIIIQANSNRRHPPPVTPERVNFAENLEDGNQMVLLQVCVSCLKTIKTIRRLFFYNKPNKLSDSHACMWFILC